MQCSAQKESHKWNLLLTPLVFALRDIPQDSTTFSPFELVYRHTTRGLLQVAKEGWEWPDIATIGAEMY